jgi:hypothetical protein
MANLVQAIGQLKLLNHNLRAMHPPVEKPTVLSSDNVRLNTRDSNVEKPLESPSGTKKNEQRLPDSKEGASSRVKRKYLRLVKEKVLAKRRKNKSSKKRYGDFFQSTDVQMKVMIDRCARHHQAILRLAKLSKGQGAKGSSCAMQ